MTLTDALRAEYQHLWDTCVIGQEHIPAIDRVVARMATPENKTRYVTAATPFVMPWYIVALIHQLECSGSFRHHLHNGDPLSARTVREPPGRPVEGNPPFTWEQSANDALKKMRFSAWRDWSLPGTLWKLEEYNGFGYRLYHPNVLSPYLWSMSNHYTVGKYRSDGKYDPKLVSDQIGTAVLLKRLAETGEIRL